MPSRPATIPIPPDIDGLIFDCDGTLADSMPAHYRAWQETLADHGVDFPEALFYQLGGVSAPRIIIMFNEKHGTAMHPEKVADEKEKRFLAMLAEIRPIEVVVETARRHRGRLKMAVASGGNRENVTETLDHLGIADWFETVVTHEDVEHPKPAPDTFLVAARRLGVPPERCMVFEDSETGLEAARRAGMAAVDIRGYRGQG